MKREILKLMKYTGKRALTLFITVIIAVYITILIANMGGYVDDIVKSEIKFNIASKVGQDPKYAHYTPEEKKELIENLSSQEIKRLGLDQPFMYRSFGYLKDALILQLGRAQHLTSDAGSKMVRNVVLERLPATVLLFTTTSVLLFFIALFVGLLQSRKYGSIFDKVMVSLAPFSSAPGWFYGIFFILVFASVLRILPYGGFVDAPPPPTKLGYTLSVLKHMILPVFSWVIGYSFVETYVRRTFFLMFSSEDYVEMAKAKGLPPRLVERRYILKPTLPPIITSFMFTLIVSWMGAVITERVFNWPGIGTLLYRAAVMFDTPVMIGIIVVYGYLLAITIFTLDIIYSLVDPRIKVG